MGTRVYTVGVSVPAAALGAAATSSGSSAATGNRSVFDSAKHTLDLALTSDDGISAEDFIRDVIDGGPGFDRARVDRGLDVVQRVADMRRGF